MRQFFVGRGELQIEIQPRGAVVRAGQAEAGLELANGIQDMTALFPGTMRPYPDFLLKSVC